MRSFPIETHIAILVPDVRALSLKELLPKEVFQNTLVFSEATIAAMIEEESRRDSSVIIEREGQSLRSMSSGERKIAVLHYLVSLAPAYLFVDNFYENLDAKNRENLEALVINVAKGIKIIQVVRREVELFSFIKATYIIDEQQVLQPCSGTVFNVLTELVSAVNIPKTTTDYHYDYKTFVKLSDVSVRFYDKPVLKGIHWEIGLGEFWQMIGENGSGKTTLLSLITGDSHKAYGQNIVLFDKLKGTEENVWEIKKKIGYFTPNITELFNARHSVLHMVLSGFYDSVGLYVKPLDLHVQLAKEWLDVIQMKDMAHTTFTTLSPGKQRMVLIARAMVKHPPLLILDEPTSGLDKEHIAIIVALINKIAKETKTTIIYVSHSVESGLKPQHVYKLSKTAEGSLGNILR